MFGINLKSSRARASFGTIVLVPGSCQGCAKAEICPGVGGPGLITEILSPPDPANVSGSFVGPAILAILLALWREWTADNALHRSRPSR